MGMSYSPSTNGFYIQGSENEPVDAKVLTDAEYTQLRADIMAGQRLVADVNGDPVLIPYTPHWNENDLDNLVTDLKEKAVYCFSKMMAYVTDYNAYRGDEKDTWSKQEQVAMAWIADWNAGTPVVTIATDQAKVKKDREYTVLVNLCAGELKIAKASVTDQNAFDKATSIMDKSVDFSDYISAILGALHGVINDINSVVLTDVDAKDQLLAVDISIIESVAAAELGL